MQGRLLVSILIMGFVSSLEGVPDRVMNNGNDPKILASLGHCLMGAAVVTAVSACNCFQNENMCSALPIIDYTAKSVAAMTFFISGCSFFYLSGKIRFNIQENNYYQQVAGWFLQQQVV